jgi:hypothetical protein
MEWLLLKIRSALRSRKHARQGARHARQVSSACEPPSPSGLYEQINSGDEQSHACIMTQSAMALQAAAYVHA